GTDPDRPCRPCGESEAERVDLGRRRQGRSGSARVGPWGCPGGYSMRYDAAAFLEGLFQQLPEETPAPGPEIRVENLDPDWGGAGEEGAAIMESDGGLHRERAEAWALAEIAKRIRRGERFAPAPPCRPNRDG